MEIATGPERVKVLGVYRVECTKSLLSAALEYKYGRIWNPIRKWLLKAAVRQEIESAVLIELLVPPPNSAFDIGKITQDARTDGNNQVAWDEHFLTDNGESTISASWPHHPELWSRVAFFLHYYRENDPLLTSFGPVVCPLPKPMPERLAKLVPYDPPD